MSDKKKKESGQPELPIEGAQPVAPETAETKNSPANESGETHVLAEAVEVVAHKPFAPGKLELALHRRVNTSFLEYASYVIRDRAIPHLADGVKPVRGAFSGRCTRMTTDVSSRSRMWSATR